MADRVVSAAGWAAALRVGRELNATLEVDRILSLLVKEMVSVTGADGGGVLVASQRGSGPERRVWRGVDGGDLAARAVRLGKRVEQVRPGGGFELAVPIRYAQQVVGALALSAVEVEALREHEAFVLLAAEQAATAIGNARRYAEQVERETRARRRSDQLRDLIRIAHVLRTGHALDEALDQVVHAIPETGGFSVALLSLAEGDPPVLRCVASAGIPLVEFATLQETRTPLSDLEPVLAECARAGHACRLPRRRARAWSVSLGDAACAGDDQAADVLLVPLWDSRRGLLGLLSVSDLQDPRVPEREQIEIVELFANEAASAIENARLYDEMELRVARRTDELADALRRQANEVEKTRAIVESISDGVIVIDPDGRVALCNPATRRVLGIEPASLVGRRLADPPDALPDAAAALLRVARSAQESLIAGQDLVDTVFQASERVIYASFAATALRSGDPLTVVAVLRDITRQAEVDRRKSESVAVAAHELKAPMTSMTSYADVLMQGTIGPVNEQQRAFLQVIKSNANRLTALVHNLLDVARLEGEGWTLDLRPVSIAEVVREAVSALRAQIEAKEQSLTVDVPDDLPRVIADRGWMIQVVTNLLSNAAKYSPRGGQVVIRGRRKEGQLQVDVSDSGMGISAEDQQHLFTPFFRAGQAVAEGEGGSGLGLAICRDILVRHGGTVRVDSELGKGSTFSMVLPLAAEAVG